MRLRITLFVSIVQSILLLAHAAVYATMLLAWPALDNSLVFKIAFLALAFSFVSASFLGMFRSNFLVRIYYTLAAGWLALLDCLVLGAAVYWLAYAVDLLARRPVAPEWLAAACFGAALATGIYGIVNAGMTRVKRVNIHLDGLPESWRGRTALVATDLHLGHVRGSGFAARMTAMINALKPDVVFVVGDLFDGSAADPEELSAPFAGLSAPFGAYFVTGNHEEFGDPSKYIRAVKKCGIAVLDNEKRTVEGLQIVGVSYRSGTHGGHFASVLAGISIDRSSASVLLLHAPDNLPVAEAAGVSLQFSGHTHRGQMFPFTLATARVYGAYVYGLNRLGNMQVLTSSGAGTWGPPARLGTNSEIVLVKFE